MNQYGYILQLQRKVKATTSVDWPFEIVKKLLNATYRIQHAQYRNQHTVVHFDHAKPSLYETR